MKNSYLVPLVLLVILSCNKDEDDATLTKKQMLTNGSSRAWRMSDISHPTETVECSPNGAPLSDNTWTFKSDGVLVYDHGTVTEGADCGDLQNITGTWEFTDSETKIKLTATSLTDFPNEEIDAEVLAHATIKSMSASKMVLEDEDGYLVTFSVK